MRSSSLWSVGAWYKKIEASLRSNGKVLEIMSFFSPTKQFNYIFLKSDIITL